MTMDKSNKTLETVTDKNGNQTRRWKGKMKFDGSVNVGKIRGISPSSGIGGAREANDKQERLRRDKEKSAEKKALFDRQQKAFIDSLGAERRKEAVARVVKKHGSTYKRLPIEEQRKLIRAEADNLPPRSSAEIARHNPGMKMMYEAVLSYDEWEADQKSLTPVFRGESFEHPEVGTITPTVRTSFGNPGEEMTAEEYNSQSNGNSLIPGQKIPQMRNLLTFEDDNNQPVEISGRAAVMDDLSYDLNQMGWNAFIEHRGFYASLDRIESQNIEDLPEQMDKITRSNSMLEDAFKNFDVYPGSGES